MEKQDKNPGSFQSMSTATTGDRKKIVSSVSGFSGSDANNHSTHL